VFFVVASTTKVATGGQSEWQLLLLALSLVVLTAVMAEREYSHLKAARLIMENQIMHIRPAVVQRTDNCADLSSPYSTTMFVSCFGILLDSRVIIFNQGAVRLWSMEVGQSQVAFKYGTAKEKHMVTLLCKTPDQAEFERISRKFRYETGIIPQREGNGK